MARRLPPAIALCRSQPGFQRGCRRRNSGLSLAEVLVGVLISAIVITAGVKTLLALLTEKSTTQQELNRKDDVGRVLGVMQAEIGTARRVESGTTTAPLNNIDPTNCKTPGQTVLILRGYSAGEDIAYGLRTQTADANWRGPAVLVRCGFSYNSDGTRNTSGGRSEQVVLDRLQADGLTAEIQGSGSNSAVSRSVSLTLRSNVAGGTNRVQVPIRTNEVYGMNTIMNELDLSNCRLGCESQNGLSKHYKPLPGDDINGSESVEDVVYFDRKHSDYTLGETPGSGSCTKTKCSIRQGTGAPITLTDVDVLVFRDIEIRL